MSRGERRKSFRTESLNLLDYSVSGQNGELVDRGMGRTLNISEKGILFETHIPLQRGQILMITIELEEELLEIGGRIIHVEPSLENFHSGVEFLQMDAKGERVLKNYLAAFKKGGF